VGPNYFTKRIVIFEATFLRDLGITTDSQASSNNVKLDWARRFPKLAIGSVCLLEPAFFFLIFFFLFLFGWQSTFKFVNMQGRSASQKKQYQYW